MLASVNPPTGSATWADSTAAEPVQHRLVQVGLGVEVPVQDHPGDPGLGGDVVQARRGEPGAGERLRRRGQDLLAPLRARQPPYRRRAFASAIDRPSGTC